MVDTVARLRPDLLELAVVDVRARRTPDEHCLVGLEYEHRPPLGLRVEGDRPHPAAVFGVELAHRADEAHGGLAAVDDRDAGDHGVTSEHRKVSGVAVAPLGSVNQSPGRVVVGATAGGDMRTAMEPPASVT